MFSVVFIGGLVLGLTWTQTKHPVSAVSQLVVANQKTEIALLQAICKATKGCVLPAS
jgi:hypothetical protein